MPGAAAGGQDEQSQAKDCSHEPKYDGEPRRRQAYEAPFPQSRPIAIIAAPKLARMDVSETVCFGQMESMGVVCDGSITAPPVRRASSSLHRDRCRYRQIPAAYRPAIANRSTIRPAMRTTASIGERGAREETSISRPGLWKFNVTAEPLRIGFIRSTSCAVQVVH